MRLFVNVIHAFVVRKPAAELYNVHIRDGLVPVQQSAELLLAVAALRGPIFLPVPGRFCLAGDQVFHCRTCFIHIPPPLNVRNRITGMNECYHSNTGMSIFKYRIPVIFYLKF